MTLSHQTFADFTGLAEERRRGSTPRAAGPVEVVAYYFPQWHPDPVNDILHEPGWTEWDLVTAAQPRFAGHQQPKRPLWGHADESDAANASRVVASAVDHGLTGFIVDWYWYDNRPFLNGFLDDGLLHADRLDELRFALMWANHEWTDLYPATSTTPATLLPAPNATAHVRGAFQHVIERYLGHPSYWRVDGAAYFSIYDVPAFVRGMGGTAGAAAMLDQFRADAARAGVGALHLNGAVNFQIHDPAVLAEQLRLDSITHYTWWHHPSSGFDSFPTTAYSRVHERARAVWREFDQLHVPYLPNVTMGWDPSPRTVPWGMREEPGYPFTSVLVDNTPAALGSALADALELVVSRSGYQIVTINAWNEWTEGSYLEPDQENGFGYLEAVRSAIAASRVNHSEERTSP